MIHLRPLISVIIPVYNVEAYLNNCLKSIVMQSYENIEIIVINDGSTDSSGTLCEIWKSSDERIRVIHKEKEGPGLTRNYGLKIAKGEFVAFIDADDWIEEHYIKKLVETAIEEGADICFCDYYIWSQETERQEKKWRIYGGLKKEDSKEHLIINTAETLCMALFKTSLFLNYGIKMPDCYYEDMAVQSQLILVSDKTSYLREPLYYYRVDRPGSTMYDYANYSELPKAIEYMLYEMKRLDLYEKYYQTIKIKIIGLVMGVLNRGIIEKQDKVVYKSLEKRFVEYLDYLYNDWTIYTDNKVLAWGSFVTKWIAQEITYKTQHVAYIGAFSSLISFFLGEKYDLRIENLSEFRLNAVKTDAVLGIGKMNSEIFSEKDYILIDFANERYDIIKNERGQYACKSDAFCEALVTGLGSYIEIRNLSAEYMILWKRACDKFIEYLKRNCDVEKIVLIRTRLAEYYGETGPEFRYKKWEHIRELNQQINMMENYFIARIEGITIISLADPEVYTSRQSRYGLQPCYLNERVYKRLGELIKCMRDNQRKTDKEEGE